MPVSSREMYWCWAILLGGLTVVLAGWIALPLSYLTSPMSLNYSEGWNAYWDEAARLGRSLYRAPPDLNITNYPPVSFHVIGLLSRQFGDVTIVGRIFSLCCLVWTALNISTAAATITRSRWAGAYALLCFLLSLAILSPTRIATNDPGFLGLALSTLGICAYLRAEGRVRWIMAAAVFFVASLFVKNNLLAFPLATALHLLIVRQVRSFVVFVGTGVLLAGLFLALTILVDGQFFLAHLLAPRAFIRIAGFESISGFWLTYYAPALISIGWLLWSRSAGTGILALLFLCSMVLAFGLSFGDGVANNVFFETLAAMALVVAAAVSTAERKLGGHSRGWILFMAVSLLAVEPALAHTPSGLYGALGRAGRLPKREAAYNAALAAIKLMDGPALCESLLMCFQAGKPFVYDPYFVSDQVRIGRIPEARIVSELNARHYAVIQLGEDDENFTLGEEPRLRFSAGVIGAILANYRVTQRSPYYAVLVPK